jgi:acyl-CoA thioesterase I
LAAPELQIVSAIRSPGPRSVYHEQLDSLMQSLWSGQHKVLMLELPLFPFKNAFGRAQREIAAEYGATMLPKRFMTKVLGIQGGTLDGLHLSQAGHDAMAGLIGGVLEREDKRAGK